MFVSFLSQPRSRPGDVRSKVKTRHSLPSSHLAHPPNTVFLLSSSLSTALRACRARVPESPIVILLGFSSEASWETCSGSVLVSQPAWFSTLLSPSGPSYGGFSKLAGQVGPSAKNLPCCRDCSVETYVPSLQEGLSGRVQPPCVLSSQHRVSGHRQVSAQWS